jgi:hypothetical protein
VLPGKLFSVILNDQSVMDMLFFTGFCVDVLVVFFLCLMYFLYLSFVFISYYQKESNRSRIYQQILFASELLIIFMFSSKKLV